MVRIRLRRVGGKKQASFRVVAADKESPRDGRFIEILGFYNPRTEPATIQLKEDRIYEWMQNGAQPSDSAMQVFQTVGLVERYERLKKGEKLEKLLEEAVKAAEEHSAGGKTRRPAPAGKPGRKAEAKAAEAAAAEAEKAEEPKKEEKKEAKAEEPKAEEAKEEKKDAKAEEPKAEEPKEEKKDAEEKAEEPKAEAKEESEADAEEEKKAEAKAKKK